MVGALVVGSVASPLGTQGTVEASGSLFAGTGFSSRAAFGSSANKNVVYGQLLATDTVLAGTTTGPYNLNNLSAGVSNMGLVVVLFSGDIAAGTTEASYRVYINAHGKGTFNDFTLLAQRNGGSYVILGSAPTLQFQNNSGNAARCTIKALPIVIHDAVHVSL